MIKYFIKLTVITCILNSQLTLANQVEVKVGGYLFPPFIDMDGKNTFGLTIDLIELLNQQQSKYHFKFIPTSPKRRYIDFKNNVFDALFFENIKWSWQQYDISASKVFLSGGEAFFTQKTENRNKDYLKKLKGKNIVAILGYHYQFLNNITDAKTLKKQFDIALVNSPKTVMNQVINDKADIGIAAHSYLQQQIKLDPSLIDRLIIGDKFDQTYEHTILIRKNHALSIKVINALLSKIKSNGSLTLLLDRYGLSALKVTSPNGN